MQQNPFPTTDHKHRDVGRRPVGGRRPNHSIASLPDGDIRVPDMCDDFALPTDIAAKVYITNPATKRRLTDADNNECWIEVHGYHSEAAQKWRFDREETLRKLGREMTAEEADVNLAEMLASLTVNWQLIAPTGRKLDVPCNYDTAHKLYTSPEQRWLRQQVLDFLGDLATFAPAGWRN